MRKKLPNNIIQLFFKTVDEKCKKNKISKSGRKRKIPRKFLLQDIVRVLRTGMQWSELRPMKGSYKTTWYYFNKWSVNKVFDKFYKQLYSQYSKQSNQNRLSIDASYVKNIGGRDCTGRNPTDRGRKATKLSVITDSTGLPVSFDFSPGNYSDHAAVSYLLDNVIIPKKSKSKKYPRYLLSDKGYDSKKNRLLAINKNLIPLIPKRKTPTQKPVHIGQDKSSPKLPFVGRILLNIFP